MNFAFIFSSILSCFSASQQVDIEGPKHIQNRVEQTDSDQVSMKDGSHKKISALLKGDFAEIKGFCDPLIIGKMDPVFFMWLLRQTVKKNADIFSLEDYPSQEKSQELDRLHEEILRLGLIESLNSAVSPVDRLTHVLVNLHLWSRADVQVWELLASQIRRQVADRDMQETLLEGLSKNQDGTLNMFAHREMGPLLEEVEKRFTRRIKDQLDSQSGGQVARQLIEKLRPLVGNPVLNRVKSHVDMDYRSIIKTKLGKHFFEQEFKYNAREDVLNENYELSIKSALMQLQIEGILIQHTPSFRVDKDLIDKFISDRISEDKINLILDTFELPESDLQIPNIYLKIIGDRHSVNT